jgi:hypothetical protein
LAPPFKETKRKCSSRFLSLLLFSNLLANQFGS